MIALATAVGTFVVGMLVLPPVEAPAPEPGPPMALTPAPAPAPPPPPPSVADASVVVDAASGETTAKPDAAAAVAIKPSEAKPADTKPSVDASAKPAKAEEPPAKGAETTKPEATAKETSGAHDKQADKDVAREAWRKNLPDISVEGAKVTMIIPIKGSIDGATYHVTAKPRSVLVTLPKAESMITMPFYSVNREGFRKLWIKKDEQSGTTTLRVTLGGDVGEPTADIKEDLVRITMRRPTESPAPAEAAPPAPAEEPSK